MSNLFSAHPTFIIDTSSLIAAHREIYARDVFDTFWHDFEGALKAGSIWMPPEVLTELNKKDDDISRWAKSIATNNPHAGLVKEYGQAVENEVKNLTPNHSKLAQKQNSADLHVMAWARELRAAVVTQENQVAQTKIPAACQKENIPCLSLLGMMQQFGWRY